MTQATAGTTKRVWIDTDCGFDDFAAIAMVHASAAWEIAGIGLVAGNAPLDIVVANAQRIHAFLGLSAPLHPGRARPVLGPPLSAQSILGEDAMKSAGESLPRPAKNVPLGQDAIPALIAALTVSREPLTILALGPLTNIAITVLAAPECAAKIAEVIWMGGSASAGNYTAAAEFNALVDPEAVTIVLRSGAALKMVGLDACRQVPVTLADVARLRQRGPERAAITADLLEGYVRIASADGSRPMALYDPTAAAALIMPETVAFVPASIAIECGAGITRGMTVCEFRPHKAPPNAAVARAADSGAIVDACLAALAGDRL